jgi:hypothetical protein
VLQTGEYFRQPAHRTALHPQTQCRYLDQQGVGRMGKFIGHHGTSVTLRTQCDTTVTAPLHVLRIPTSYRLLEYPSIVDGEVEYRYSMGAVRLLHGSPCPPSLAQQPY